MRPKFEWIINVVMLFLFLIGGSLLVFLSRFTLGAVIEGIVLYGGFGYLLLSSWLNRRQKNSSSSPSRKRRTHKNKN